MRLPSVRPLSCFLALLACTLLASPVAAQTPTITATRTDRAPVVDGRDDDPIWKTAPVNNGFRQSRPTENSEPTHRTEFRVAYDPENLYVFIRAYDDHPDSIISQMARRDDLPPSDYVSVLIDSYHDRRTGYEFVITPAGVKTDYSIFSDGNEDTAWDGIWDVATKTDSLGWTGEFRIPFSQLRFAPSSNVTFGFSIWRQVQRNTTVNVWPLYLPSKGGLASQFGDLTGLIGLANPRRAEINPYVLTQNEPRAGASGLERHQRISVGGDLKFAVAPNVTLNATVNPDFGQVEADPGELNLSAFESFFSERRPFFVAGANTFDFRVNCFAVVDCGTGEALFYSRRIGRSPALFDRYGDASSPNSTRVLGAAKLTGRLPGGFSIGLLDAMTGRVEGTQDRTTEPRTNFAVLRANQDYAGGNGSVGLMATAVNRSLDQWTEDYMHRSAYSGGLDARRRFGRFEVSGSAMASQVSGTATAIATTQRRATHYFQRPDDELEYDASRTSLSGYSTEIRFAKVSGQRTGFETGYGRRSSGFETNDIGFLNRANQQTWTNWFAFRFNKPNKVFQRLNWNLNWWQYWTLEGLPTDRAFNTNVHTQLNNRWWFHLGGTLGVGQVYCDRNCTRGGPALKTEPIFAPWGGIQGDDRKMLVPGFWFNYNNSDGGRSNRISLQPSVNMKLSSRFSTSFNANYSKSKTDAQWFGNFADNSGVTHYTFAALEQKTLGVTWRLNYTFSPTATLQWYANPFLTKGSYSRVRELDDPRADEYQNRFKPYTDPSVANNPGGFNVTQFRTNAVFRWEYRPGSTLFLVWSQGREGFAPEMGSNSFRGDFSDLLSHRADDRFLVKVSYWLNR